MTDVVQLAGLLGAQELPPQLVELRSGGTVEVQRALRDESLAPEPPAKTASCWAPNKPSLLFDGQSTWAEFVLVRLLERDGWEARWVKNWMGRREFCVDVGRSQPMAPAAWDLFKRIDGRAASRTVGGAWDIFAWRGDKVLILESKQHKSGDRLHPGQVAWLEAGIAEGVDPSAFGIVEYRTPAAGRHTPAPPAPELLPSGQAPDAPMSTELASLLADVEAAPPMTRIELRDEVAAFGAPAVRAMERWLDDDRLRRFAIRTLEVLQANFADASRSLGRYAASGLPDSDLAASAISPVRSEPPPRSSTRLTPDIYMASGRPEARIGDCEVLVGGRPCSNPGRHPLPNGMVSCTTHRKAYERRVWRDREGRPWTEEEYALLFGRFPPDAPPPSPADAARLGAEVQRTPDAISWQWTDGARYVAGRSASTTNQALMAWLDRQQRWSRS